MRSYESSLGRDSRESSEDTDVERGRVTGSSWCSVLCILFLLLLVRRLGTGRQNIAAVVTAVVKRDVAPLATAVDLIVVAALKRDVAPLVTGQLLRKLSLTNSDPGGWAGLGWAGGRTTINMWGGQVQSLVTRTARVPPPRPRPRPRQLPGHCGKLN